MHALFDLVHSLAKEEKRLYNLHGRKSRFVNIYKGYLSSSEFSKNLDREIYAKHFSSFSKAFYSMQKNALLDDILAVLLEYSNSSKDDFIINRYKAKYEVLNYKGFHEQALTYIRAALDACGKVNSPRLSLRLLEDYRDTLAKSAHTSWEEYSEILSRVETTSNLVAEKAPFDEDLKKVNVLVNTTRQDPENADAYKEITSDILSCINAYADKNVSPDNQKAAFDSEYLYSQTFEDKYALHSRLIDLEKRSSKEGYPSDIRLQIVSLLMESAMECGDFLLINGLIYKMDKQIPALSPRQKQSFLPRYLELCGIYYFYENDLPASQNKLRELMAIEGQEEKEYIRYYFHLIGVLIAANLPRTALETLNDLLDHYNHLRQEISVKLIQLIVTVEMNKKEEAMNLMQKLSLAIRKNKDSRKLTHFRQFSDNLKRFLERKPVTYECIDALETDWMDLLKLNLWFKAKSQNNFYYNNILDYWQGRKTVLRF